jgi:hypothetical protein
MDKNILLQKITRIIMKYIKLILIILFLYSCSVEQRIKEYSYTTEWYYINSTKYQVYKTRSNRKYIIILNKKETRLKRFYIN